MEESINHDEAVDKKNMVKTSSSDGSNSDKTTGDSEVQKGEGVLNHEEDKDYDQADDQQEYIEHANNNTEIANKNPVQDGKGLTNFFSSDDDDDNDSDDDDEDDPLTETEIGDDPNETKKKIPVM